MRSPRYRDLAPAVLQADAHLGFAPLTLQKTELMAATARPGRELVRGANGVDAGVMPELVEDSIPKFREGGLNVVRAGGEAGLMSAVIGGWVASGPRGSSPVTREVGT